MIPKTKLNVFTGKFDLVEHIPELTEDPASPNEEDAWVLKTGGGVTGGGEIQAFLGLGWPYPAPGTSGGAESYEFSYKTKSGDIVRADLS